MKCMLLRLFSIKSLEVPSSQLHASPEIASGRVSRLREESGQINKKKTTFPLIINLMSTIVVLINVQPVHVY